jgi:hypothetical protein
MLVAAVYKSRTMQRWVHLSRTMQLSLGEDVAGQCMESSQPVWDSQYSSICSAPEHRRSVMARQLGIRTAFGVPVPGCGVLVFYSSNLVSENNLLGIVMTNYENIILCVLKTLRVSDRMSC